MKPQTQTVLSLLALLLVSSPICAQSLPFRILEQEQQRKGGLKYVLFLVKAAVTDPKADLTKPKVEATLRQLLRTVRVDAQRSGAQLDGVTAFLYQSRDHVKGGDRALGRAEWWPKGHSFSADNIANVQNKVTYVETVEVWKLPRRASSVVSRLREATRREIFAALVRLEDKARREAEAKYPTLGDSIPFDKLRNYDWEGAMRKNMKENERLREEYVRKLLRKYKISKSELQEIGEEADVEQWPLPPLR